MGMVDHSQGRLLFPFDVQCNIFLLVHVFAFLHLFTYSKGHQNNIALGRERLCTTTTQQPRPCDHHRDRRPKQACLGSGQRDAAAVMVGGHGNDVVAGSGCRDCCRPPREHRGRMRPRGNQCGVVAYGRQVGAQYAGSAAHKSRRDGYPRQYRDPN